MGKNNFCIHFCVGVMILVEIVGGPYQFTLTVIYDQHLTKLEVLCSLVVSTAIFTSGGLLLIGAKKRKLRYVHKHVRTTVVCMILDYGGFTRRMFVTTFKPDTAIMVLSIFAGMFIFLGIMEYGVYLFYTNLESELEQVDTV